MFKSDARFLIIDDSESSRDLVRTALKQLKLRHIDEAENGNVGWNKILRSLEEQKPYSVVFCDINMPEMDGLKLLETARSDKRTETLPFLMITTEGAKQSVIRAVMSGVSGYLVKPFGIEEIKKKMQEIYDRVLEEGSHVIH
jgi:two-component system chemotaxis response regulator CheY